MRRIILLAVAVSVSFLLLSASTCAAEQTFLSVGGGVFNPGADYDKIVAGNEWSKGVNANLSYTMVNENTGLEFGLNGFNSANEIDMDSVSLGLEVLIHFHKTDVTFQPFLAFGLGRYKNTVTDITGTENVFSGGGSVLKFGARYYLADTFYVSAFYKRFTNKISMYGLSYDLGGDVLGAELGIVRF